jgi:hypothetical protein
MPIKPGLSQEENQLSKDFPEALDEPLESLESIRGLERLAQRHRLDMF